MATINYTSLLHSTAADGKLAKAEEIFDDVLSKFQSEINSDVLNTIEESAKQVETAIKAEVTRAIAAEKVISDNLTNEITRALNAESTETNIRQLLINDLRTDLNSEITNCNTAITNAIKNLDSTITSTDGNNVLVKITEVDGKITDVNITKDNTVSKADVNTAIANLINSAPETLDTLGELAKALQDHEDEYDALLEVVGNKIEDDDINVKNVDNYTIVLDDRIASVKVNTETSKNENKTSFTTTPVSANLISNDSGIGVNINTYVYDGSRDMNALSTNLVEEKALHKHINEVTNLIDDLSGQLLVLQTESKVTTTLNPSTIYKATATNVTVTATFSASDSTLIPATINIKLGSTEVVSTTSSKTVNEIVSVNITNNTQSYTSSAIINGITLTHTINLNARYPIYYGFAASKPTSFTDLTKVAATTTASREYSGICNGTGYHFYVLVPTDITAPTSFTMGGAPFTMNTTSATIEGINYKILESGSTYNDGASVKVKM